MKRFAILPLLLQCALTVAVPAVANQWEQLGSPVMLTSRSSKGDGDISNIQITAGDESVISLRPLVVDVSQDGLRVAVGSPSYGDGLGAVFVFEWQNSADIKDSPSYDWTLVGSVLGQHGNEGLGDSVSLSGDGMWLAVRRNLRPQGRSSPSSRVVQVYHINVYGSMQQNGDDVACSSNDSSIQSVTLGQAPLLSDDGNFTDRIWLILGCESRDSGRGIVQAFYLMGAYDADNEGDQASKLWEPYLPPLLGTNPGDGFGLSTSFVKHSSPSSLSGNDPIFRLAVSSPRYDNNRGKVRVYTAYAHGWATLGSELLGSFPGELFGWDLGMSASSEPFLIVASPERLPIEGKTGDNDGLSVTRSHGAVQVFHWKASSDYFISFFEWNLAGKPLTVGKKAGIGIEDARFGYAVAISMDGNRIAVSSATVSSSLGNHVGNAVYVYDRDFEEDSITWNLTDEYGVTGDTLWSPSVALNRYGSVAVTLSYATSGGGDTILRAFLDKSPFCTPPSFTQAPIAHTWNEGVVNGTKRNYPLGRFFDRSTCRDTSGNRLITSRETCSKTKIRQNGTVFPCVWATGQPYPEPTSSPIDEEFVFPTKSPTMVTANPDAPGQSISPSACHCDKEQECTDLPLLEGTTLHVCITRTPASADLLSVDSFYLEQESILVSVVEHGQALDAVVGDVTLACTGNACIVQVPVNSLFFGPDQPLYLVFKGTVIVDVTGEQTENIRPRRNGDFSGMFVIQSFESVLSLQRNDVMDNPNRATSDNTFSEKYVLLGLRWLFVALVFAAGFSLWMRRRLRHDEQRLA